MADVAGHVDVGQELHLHADDAVALTGLASASLDVEAEAACRVAAFARSLRLFEHLADGGEDARIGRRV